MKSGTAFVTGGSGGIGKAICLSLAKDGYDVAVGYKSSENKAQDTVKEIQSIGQNAVAVFCDVADVNSVKDAFSFCKNNLGKVSVLINNAGLADINLFTHIPDEKINEIIGCNLVGAMNMSRAVLPDMINEKNGTIINISSMWGEVGASCEVVYSATKAGLIGFTKALAKEVGLSGIRVNCVTAGLIDTPMNESLSESDISDIIEDIPLSRIGKPQDIADAVSFLVSEKASYITGAVLKVNGGMCI